MLRRLARQLARPVVPGIATVATPKSTRRDKPFPSARCVTSSETTEATGDPSAPLVRLSAPAVSAECLSEAIFRQNARHDGIRRVGPGLKDIEARVLWPYREPHGLPERPRDPPLTPHELDPASELDASRDVPRQEQAQHLLVRCRTDARLSLRYEPLHPLVGDFAGFVVHVRPAPEVDVLAGDKVCVRLIVDALGLEDDDYPVLERAHRPFDLPLRLRRRGDAVIHSQRPAHAPELGAEVLALLPEHRESVRVVSLGTTVAQD